jgi:hypothetical protein
MLKKILNYVRNLLWPKKDEALGSKIEWKDTTDESFSGGVDPEPDLLAIEPGAMEPTEALKDDYVPLPPWNGKPTVSIDFDGVIHSYKSGWQGADDIPDEPIYITTQRTGKKYTSIDWLTELVNSDTMNVAIFSSRNTQEGGIKAMQTFLLFHGMDFDTLMKIYFPEHKPPSHVLIDDRCLRFEGEFFSVDQILKFTPWKMR